MLAPPPAGAAGALGVGAGGTGAGPLEEEAVELDARPIFVGVASFDDIDPFLETFARPIVNGIIDDEVEDFWSSSPSCYH